MARSIRYILFFTLIASIVSVFLNQTVRGGTSLNAAAAGVFLFNLTSGGLLIVTHLSGFKSVTARSIIFYLCGIAFAAGALLNAAHICIVSALIAAAVVESVRWKKFSWFPADFFRRVPTSKKFEQASLLCLSMGLIICAATLVNNEWLNRFSLPKLDLHVFFLGFSFPISLITFSFIFSRLESDSGPPKKRTAEYCFWALNLGVIFFFIAIILGIYPAQLVMALTLLTVVFVTAHMHRRAGSRDAHRLLISSALAFLTLGSILGTVYTIVLWLNPDGTAGYLLSLHSATTVWGWNMTMVLILSRKDELPLRIDPRILIALHWAFVLLLPAARVSLYFAGLDLLVFAAFAGMFLFLPSARPAAAVT